IFPFNSHGGNINCDLLASQLVITNTFIAGTPGGARWEITSAHIAGYNGVPALQCELLSSNGTITAGGGNVTIDASGITIEAQTLILKNTNGIWIQRYFPG
ncbi:MAG: hypothetical protein KJ658_14455, partial [Proteobacteria bacterium]|nr:hypothetical protein [Pseudomonadota bacterium]